MAAMVVMAASPRLWIVVGLIAYMWTFSTWTRGVECVVPSSSGASLTATLEQRAAVAEQTQAWALGLSSKHSSLSPDIDRSLERGTVTLPPCNATVTKAAVVGNGTYRTVQDAINNIPTSRGNRRWVICVRAGVYVEKVRLMSSNTYVTLVGASRDPKKVIISWNDTAGTADPTSTTGGTLGTFRSYTFAAEASYFTAMYMTFRNTAPRPVDGSQNGQAVALRATGDYISFFRCDFWGYQDTLYAHQGIQFYKNCNVRGSVDFIFGNATAWFYKCYLFADVVTKGFLTAQSRGAVSQGTGFAFYGGSVKGTGVVYLGRAWGVASRVVFFKTFLDSIIAPAGWDDWGKPTDAIFYAEYKCSGPGSASSGRVNWSIQLSDAEARIFGSCDFISAKQWQGSSGLPSAGLPC
ncbi:hypothetical protein CBR_g32303 [Chara braunii]|uniref:Pectinesterase n=1 Tax=Chara braunii TaxID=69332 RepID=A0A388JN82_CHABU|nr:hypothetical protein CBR_g32303 [Chara braunii]|eukprot:GBG59290.1 hypothetical protein CBR_g32303 [Chara braunii]